MRSGAWQPWTSSAWCACVILTRCRCAGVWAGRVGCRVWWQPLPRAGNRMCAAGASWHCPDLTRPAPCVSLQDHVQHITFGKLSKQDLHSFSEEQVIKLFELAQLIMEYLLSVQGTLAANETALRGQCEMLRQCVTQPPQPRARGVPRAA